MGNMSGDGDMKILEYSKYLRDASVAGSQFSSTARVAIALEMGRGPGRLGWGGRSVLCTSLGSERNGDTSDTLGRVLVR